MKRMMIVVAFLLLAGVGGAQVSMIPKGSGGGGLTSPVGVADGGTGSTSGVGLVDTCTDSVGTDSYACSTATTCPANLANTRPVLFTAGTANTDGATFAYCSLAAKAIVKTVGGISTALATNDILAKQPVLVRYNAADDNWKMISAISNAPTATVTTASIEDATYCGASAVGSDSYACTLTTAPANLAAMEGVAVSFKADVANTGAATIAFNGFAATAIVKVGATTTTALSTNDIRAGSVVTVVYDGTSFECLSCEGNRAGLTTAQSWSGVNTYGAGITLTTGSGFIVWGTTVANGDVIARTSRTPDAPNFETGTNSNSYHFSEQADGAYDFQNGACGTSACTDPVVNIFPSTQDATQYLSLAAWGEAGGAIKTLTESAATALVRIPVAQGAGTGGSLRYTVWSTDTTDHQIREGEIKFAVVNKAGTETCTISAASEAADGSVLAASLGTLTYGITCATAAADTVDINLNAVSSLTQTTLQAWYSVKLVGPGQPARQ